MSKNKETSHGEAPDEHGESETGNGNEKLLQQLQNLANRQGGTDAAGVLLLDENRTYRKRIGELEDKLKEQALPEGAVVLTPEQVTAWQAYQQLGTAEELGQMRQSYTALKREQLINKAAQAHGYKAAVLGKLLGDTALEFKEVEVEGQKKEVAYVGDKPLNEHVTTNFADFMPALATEPGSSNGGAGGGTPFPKQNAGTTQASNKGYVQSRLDRERKAREQKGE